MTNIQLCFSCWAEGLQIMTNIKEAHKKKAANIFFVNIKCPNKRITTESWDIANNINIIYDTFNVMT